MSGLSDIAIRQAERSDLPQIIALWQALQEINADYEPRLTPNVTASEWFTDYLRDQLDNQDAAIYVAFAEKAVIGYVLGQIMRRPTLADGDCGYVTDLCVAGGWRGQGLGRRLFETISDWFHKRGLHAIEVQVIRANPASQAFWRKMGFEDFLRTLRKEG